MESDLEDNFIILIQALKFASVGLKEYAKHGLNDLYTRLRRKITDIECTQMCSRNVFDVKKWCHTCQKWKNELEKYMRFSKLKHEMKWQNINVSLFSMRNFEIAENELFRVFLRGIVPSAAKYDIQTVLSLFQNCTYFDVGNDLRLLTSIRNVRNSDFAHTEDFKLSNVQLQKDINVLLRLFRQPSVYCCSRTPEILNKLKGLRKRDKGLIEKETRRFYVYIKENQAITKECLETLEYPANEQKARQRSMKSIIRRSSSIGFLFMILFYICGLWTMNYHQIEPEFKDVCIKMDYKEPFKLDFDFEFYRSQHGPLIGRNWLLNDLDDHMYSSERGVLLVAETGYGKSAIVSHLICQNDKRLPGNWIYERIVFYHLCRHDSRKSLSPGLFVKSLAGSFSNRIRRFHDILKSNKFYEVYFKQDECLKDPEGCFDFLIMQSLKQLKEILEKQIIMIDAIDECMEYGGLNIFTLLQSRIKKLPHFISFLITTRNITAVTSVMRSVLYIYEQDSQSSKNAKDIEVVMQHKINQLSKNDYYNLKTNFKTSNISLMISSASKFSRYNMLYLTYAFEVWIQNDSTALIQTPSTFEDFFQFNLEKIFGNNDRFDKVRGLFEVLCATLEPISDGEVLYVANIPKENHIHMWKLFGNEMSHFIRHEDGKLSIAHIKLSKFLTDKKRKYEKFYISGQDGNLKLAKYWLSKVEQQMSFRNIDLIQLVIYVSESEDKLLRKRLIKYGKRYGNEFKNVFMLHHAAVSMNSYHGMVILIHIFRGDIEKRDYKGNFTAAYLASAFGNYRTLHALREHGADIHFVRLGPEIVKTNIGVEEFCKTFAHWGYSLLNIASQKGHLEIVATLIEHGVNVSHTNSMGLNSFHLAAEYGHIQVVRHFLNHFRDKFVSSFDHALYLAARNGHYNVVEVLLYHGARDNCVPCNATQYWTEFHETRLQTIENLDDLESMNHVFKDDRRFIRCETALEISIQNGHDDIAKLLMDASPSSLSCRESGGRTPLLSAIKFRRREILMRILLSDKASNNRCLFRRDRWKNIDLSREELKEYTQNQCDFNSSISKFSVINGDFESCKILQNYGLMNWLEKDVNGDTPLHFTSCRGDIEMIKLFENYHNIDILNVRTKNGSTPLHLAALCRKFNLLSYFLETRDGHIFDNTNRSISHYFTLSSPNRMNTSLYIKGNLKGILTNEILSLDVYNRTPLHYAAVHGNVDYLSFLFSFGFTDIKWWGMLHLHDLTGKKIIELVFENVPVFEANPTYGRFHCLSLFTNDSKCSKYRWKMLHSSEQFICY